MRVKVDCAQVLVIPAVLAGLWWVGGAGRASNSLRLLHLLGESCSYPLPHLLGVWVNYKG